MKQLDIYIISDTAGLAISEIVNLSLKHFDVSYNVHIKSPIRDIDLLSQTLASIKNKNILIYHSFQDSKMSAYIQNFTQTHEISSIDLMAYSINSLSKVLGENPIKDPKFSDVYENDHFRKLDALDFAMKFDDGADFRGIKFCDIAIIGVSRSSKTPLSMYLASKGLKVSNIPLIIDSKAPRELFEIDPRRIFGLTIDKEVLKKVRDARIKSLKLSNDSIYSSMERIEKELKYANEFMEDLGCRVIDVTYKSIEETSDIILNYLNENKLLERKEE
ncbi:MAG: pyruvate, water dikinase regulatory protein [Anaerococcus prevotii]|nr:MULTISPECIES: pyruvate, water dikinase regulatory protein [Anaerococcus]MDU5149232.1 pyruvate, water dikinase regulatory protein [Anaerococcus prevotii]